jgi:hypothetical protein
MHLLYENGADHMSIPIDRSLHLPAGEYLPGPERKTGIAIHHTVGGSAASTIRWWREDGALVGTAYVVDRDGTVYEAFPPEAWAYQFGLTWPTATRLAFERRFVGVELASEGALIERDGVLYCFDRVSPKTKKPQSDAFDHGRAYRGCRWFDSYEDAQLTAVALLADELCRRFGIPRQFPDPPFAYYGDALARFEGVIGHAMVRRDKTDPAPDPRLWHALVSLASVKPVSVVTQTRAGTAGLTSHDVERLFHDNVTQLRVLAPAAGSLVKALLMELERRRTYVRLHDPAPDGHTVGYTHVQGDRRWVRRLATALGFAAATDDTLEVRHA